MVEYLERYTLEQDVRGRRLAVRNGYLPERDPGGLGAIKVRQPRVDDRKLRESREVESFTSNILPRYLKRIPKYKLTDPGFISERDLDRGFSKGIIAITGESAKGLNHRPILFD